MRRIWSGGKFQGVMQAVTPIGCLSVMIRLALVVAGIVMPWTRRASSANQSMKPMPYWISPMAWATGLPCSRLSS